MNAAVVGDLEALVAPVAGQTPAGADLRYLPIFDEIKAARRAAEEDPGELAPWRKVADLVTRAAARSKDLQLGVWLLEAFARIDGYRGAAVGLAVMRRLLDDFWDSVYPQLDPDDADPPGYRRALLHWINDRLPAILKGAPLTGSGSLYGLIHYEVTLKTGEERKALLEQGWPNADQFAQALEATPAPLLQQVLVDVTGCSTEVSGLQAVIDRRFDPAVAGGGSVAQPDPVTFVRLQEALDSTRWIVERALERRQPAGARSPESGGAQQIDRPPASPTALPGGADAGWHEALQLTRDSRVDGLRLMQAQLAASASGREQFLRQLQLAELSLEAGVYSLAYPVFDELLRTVDSRNLEGWEEQSLITRVLKGLERCCALLKSLNAGAAAREAEVLDRLSRLASTQTPS